QPVAHRVRSDRNAVVVEFDPPSPSGPGAVSLRSAVDPIAALGLNAPQAPAATPTPQPPAPPTLGTGQPNERRYTGHPVSLDFQGADLRAVLRTFAELSGLNIVIDPKVNGTVD